MSNVRFLLNLLREINPEDWGKACTFLVLYPLATAFIVVLVVGLS